MSDENDLPGDDVEPPRDSKGDDVMKSLLKRSLAAPEEAGPIGPAVPRKSLLPAVQKKLRERSKGKFYADGWSTASSRVNYAMVAIVMLVVIAICWFALGPVGVTGR